MLARQRTKSSFITARAQCLEEIVVSTLETLAYQFAEATASRSAASFMHSRLFASILFFEQAGISRAGPSIIAPKRSQHCSHLAVGALKSSRQRGGLTCLLQGTSGSAGLPAAEAGTPQSGCEMRSAAAAACSRQPRPRQSRHCQRHLAAAAGYSSEGLQKTLLSLYIRFGAVHLQGKQCQSCLCSSLRH